MAKKKQTTTENQAEELLKMAASAGLEQNYFFTTTFDRYQTQIDILAKLKAAIEEEGIFDSQGICKRQREPIHAPGYQRVQFHHQCGK